IVAVPPRERQLDVDALQSRRRPDTDAGADEGRVQARDPPQHPVLAQPRPELRHEARQLQVARLLVIPESCLRITALQGWTRTAVTAICPMSGVISALPSSPNARWVASAMVWLKVGSMSTHSE